MGHNRAATPSGDMKQTSEVLLGGSGKAAAAAAVTPSADSMKSLRSQYDIANRSFAKLFEDILLTHDSHRLLRRDAEQLFSVVVERTRQSAQTLKQLRDALSSEADGLRTVKGWVHASAGNTAIAQVRAIYIYADIVQCVCSAYIYRLNN